MKTKIYENAFLTKVKWCWWKVVNQAYESLAAASAYFEGMSYFAEKVTR